MELTEGIKNHKLHPFLTFVEEMDNVDDSEEFWYAMYESAEDEELFPLGMDEYAVVNTPTFVQVGGAKFEGPNVVAVMRKLGRVYSEHMVKAFLKKLKEAKVGAQEE